MVFAFREVLAFFADCFGERFAVEGGGEINHSDVVLLDRTACDVFKLGEALADAFELGVDLLIGDGS